MRSRFAGFAVIGVVLLATGASAQNILTNPGFDTGLQGWQTSVPQQVMWDGSSDHQGSPSSGSVLMLGDASAGGSRLDQCVGVSPAAPRYGVALWLRLNAVPSGSWSAVYNASLYDGNGCMGAPTAMIAGGLTSLEGIGLGNWLEIFSASLLTPTASTGSIRVSLFASATGLSVNFDQVTLAPSGGPPAVTIDGPATGSPGEMLRFTARGRNCIFSDLATGWIWNTGGVIEGRTDAATIGVTYANPGSFSILAQHQACPGTSFVKGVTIAPRGPQVVLGNPPRPITQRASEGGGSASFVVTNVGDASTAVTLTRSGTFFTVSPGSLALGPKASQVVTITGEAVAAGAYDGAVVVSGNGVPPGSEVPVRLLATAPAPPDVVGSADRNRVDIAGTGSTGTGSVTFTNPGSSALEGVLTASERWIRTGGGLVSIPAGGSVTLPVTVERALRPREGGSVFGDLTLSWASVAGSAKTTASSTPSLATSVAVTDTVPPAAAPPGIPPLADGEVALFVPGVGHVVGSVGTFVSDLSIANLTRGETLSDLKLYFNPIGGAPAAAPGTSLASLLPNYPVAFVDLVSTVFGSTTQLGSLQVRTGLPDRISVSANVFNASNPAGTFGTLVPTIRSDRAAGAGESIYLTGLRASATSHTNLYLQETAGTGVELRTEFLGPEGQSLATRVDVVPGFGLMQLGTVVPEGGVSAIVTQIGGSGRFFAYATPVDRESGDTWAVSDWAQQFGYARSERTVLPVAGSLLGANETFFRTDVSIMNAGTTVANGTLRYVPRDGTPVERALSIPSRHTAVLADVTGTFFDVAGTTVGWLEWVPSSGEVVMTSRNFTTSAVLSGTFGTAVPSIGRSQSLRFGDLRRMAGIEDASLATIAAARPATFRTNFGLVETSGQPATVRVTIRYDFNGTLAVTRGSAHADYALGPNQFLQVNSLARAIIGEERETGLGDLRNVEVDFEVIDGDGGIMVYVSSIDNGTGDSLLRTE